MIGQGDEYACEEAQNGDAEDAYFPSENACGVEIQDAVFLIQKAAESGRAESVTVFKGIGASSDVAPEDAACATDDGEPWQDHEGG